MSLPAEHPHGGHKPTTGAWASVILMIVGFLLCTLAFIIGNTLALWIPGGILGFIGIVLARTSNIMEQSH
jgi:hypothetical protein